MVERVRGNSNDTQKYTLTNDNQWGGARWGLEGLNKTIEINCFHSFALVFMCFWASSRTEPKLVRIAEPT